VLTRIEKASNAKGILMVKPEGKPSIWKENIIMYLGKVKVLDYRC
jgi:hypothetical protein